jgi:Transposase DDE domain
MRSYLARAEVRVSDAEAVAYGAGSRLSCCARFTKARDMARGIAKTQTYQTSRYQRKKVEMLFAHLKRILKLDRLRLRGPNGARDELHLAATAQNLRKLAKLMPAPAPIPASWS